MNTSKQKPSIYDATYARTEPDGTKNIFYGEHGLNLARLDKAKGVPGSLINWVEARVHNTVG